MNAPLSGGSGTQSDNSANRSGAAYVFVRSGGTWSQQAYLKASNTGAGDVFGIVAISGDTVVVGALGLLYIVAYLDRANVGFAKLRMGKDLGFSEEVFGLGIGIFFLGYLL